MCGSLFVLYTGIPWHWLPQELGFGCGMTCWRRLRDWHEAGVWQELHEVLLAELRRTDRLDLERVVVDSTSVAWRPKTGRSPVDRGRPGSKHHVVTDANGIPLAATLTGGNRNDVTQIKALVETIGPIRGRIGRSRRRPKVVQADRGYDHDKYRRVLHSKGIRTQIVRRGTAHGTGLGATRYVVEQTIALLHWFRRPRIRWEPRADIHEAFLSLGCALICWRRLQKS